MRLQLLISVFLVILVVSNVDAKKMDKGEKGKKGGGGGGGGDDWEAYPTGGKCNCNCGGGDGKTKVIAMEKVIKVPRIRILDMGKKGDDLQYMKSKSMVGMVMSAPQIEMMDEEVMDSWNS